MPPNEASNLFIFYRRFEMKYIIRWFESARVTVMVDILACVCIIKLVRYTRLLDQCKIDACEYKQYANNLMYKFCYKCDQYNLIDVDAAMNAYNGFIKDMNENL